MQQEELRMEFIFKLSELDTQRMTEQLTMVLDKRSELYSREKLPGLWKLTDKLNNRTKVSEEVRKRRILRLRIYGIFLLILGTILFVPGLCEPTELRVPLIVGGMSVALGIYNTFIVKAKKKERPKRIYKRLRDEAEKIITNLNDNMGELSGQTISVKEKGLVEKEEVDRFKFKHVKFVMITVDAYFFLYETSVIILQKNGLEQGTNEEFEKFLMETVGEKLHHIEVK